MCKIIKLRYLAKLQKFIYRIKVLKNCKKIVNKSKNKKYWTLNQFD